MPFFKLLRRVLPLLLLGALSNCTVYDRVFHPYRLPTPTMGPEARAKARAAEKARHKGTSLKPAETEAIAAGTDPAAPSATPVEAASQKKTLSYSELPEGTKLKYDEHLLIKEPKMEYRQRHHYDTAPLPHRAASRDARRMRKHPKGKDSSGPRREAPTTPAPDEGMSPPTPTRAPDPAPAPPAKAKSKKVPIPKPDPTQPATGN